MLDATSNPTNCGTQTDGFAQWALPLPPHVLCRTQLACCSQHDAYSDSHGYKPGSSKDLLQELQNVGVCSYSEEYFTKAIKYEGSDTTKIGVFSVEW